MPGSAAGLTEEYTSGGSVYGVRRMCIFPRGLPEGFVRGLHLGNPEEERAPEEEEEEEEGERGLKEMVIKSPTCLTRSRSQAVCSR